MTEKAGAAPEKKPVADWFIVEKEYRAGVLSLREIASGAGITEGAVRKRAKKDGWSRDLQAKILAKTEEKVRKEAVRTSSTQLTAEDERTVVEANADLQFQVRMSHRRGLDKLRTVKEKLVAQIEQAVDNFVDLQEVIEMVRNPDENGMDKANDALRKAMGRSSVVDDLKKLSEIDERVRKGEREAFGLDNLPSDGAQDPMAAFLAELSARGSRLPIGGAK